MQLVAAALRHPAGRRLHDERAHPEDVRPSLDELIEERWSWLVAVVRHLDDDPRPGLA